jgi:4-amino-4-deoxy-L-arabinose transferase-like glycosyltransferase
MAGLIAALLIRAGFLVADLAGAANVHETDSYSYVREAYLVVDQNIYDFWLRPPGYPFFLILSGTVSEWLTLTLQTFLGVGTCALVYFGGRRLFGEAAARWALLFVALDMTSIVYGNMILAESLFTALLTAALLCVVLSSSLRGAAASAVLLALACYVKPVALALAVLWPGLLWLVLKKPKHSLVFLGVAWALLLPWFFRQHARFGVFMFSGIQAQHPLIHNAAYVLADVQDTPLHEVQQRLKETVPFENRNREAFRIIARHPFIYAVQVLNALPITLLSPAPNAFRRMLPALPSALYYAGLVLACLFWLWLPFALVGFRRRAVVFILVTASYLLLVPGAEGRSRFRVPSVPALALCAAYGVTLVLAAREKRRGSPAGPTLS